MQGGTRALAGGRGRHLDCRSEAIGELWMIQQAGGDLIRCVSYEAVYRKTWSPSLSMCWGVSWELGE